MLYLLGELTLLSLYNVFCLLWQFLSLFCLMLCSYPSSLFIMEYLFPSCHFNPIHVLRFVIFNSSSSLTLSLCFSLSLSISSSLLHLLLAQTYCTVVNGRSPGQPTFLHSNFRGNASSVFFRSWRLMKYFCLIRFSPNFIFVMVFSYAMIFGSI